MRRKKAKKAICLSLTALMVSGMMLASGCGETESSSETDFTYWVYTTDGVGTFYDDYTNNPGVQYINQQYWDADKHTLGTEENGTKINLKIQAPIAGAEQDNYNTMISTEQYPELLDLSAAAGTTPEQMYKDGILMEITEQVEKYMPDYVALLEENPDIKAKVMTTDKEGKTHYYYLPSISDSPGLSWDGFTYRRDWIVKYGTPSKYIWDWESDYVKEHGHPEVTPMEAAVAAGNLNGWKKNEIRSFTKTEGDDPDNDWEDNVVFPSGKTYPYTISDWEWMFEAFDKAIEDKGFSDNSNAQCITIPYQGAILTGELVSSFGGGGFTYYITPNGEVEANYISDRFKVYLECMNQWYEKGWLDQTFETRTGDMFYMINDNGFAQGMVGMRLSATGIIGSTIRVTCTDPEDKENAMVMGCPLPINDKYGTDENKFVVPDVFYQFSRVLSGGLGVTTKCEDKNLPALFTFLNWMYTEDGALLRTFGLSEEQYQSIKLEEDIYAENQLTSAFTVGTDEDGKTVYTPTMEFGSDLSNAMKPQRLVGAEMTGTSSTSDYRIDRGNSKVLTEAHEFYAMYSIRDDIVDYKNKMSQDELDTYDKLQTKISEYISQEIPVMIKEGTKGKWDTYVAEAKKLGAEEICELYQPYVDEVYQTDSNLSQ